MQYTHDRFSGLRRGVSVVVAILTIIPLAPILNRYIPPLMVGDWNFDLVVSVALAAFFTYVVLRIFHFLLIPIVVMFVGVMLYNSLTNGRGLGRVISDYQVM